MADTRIISIRLEEQTGGIGVNVELGEKSVGKQIPNGQGLVRLNAVLVDNELSDVELVTQKNL